MTKYQAEIAERKAAIREENIEKGICVCKQFAKIRTEERGVSYRDSVFLQSKYGKANIDIYIAFPAVW